MTPVDHETARLARGAVPLFVALAVALLVLAVAAILSLGRDIFVPVALAILVSFVLAPGVRALQRLGLPQGLAVPVTVLCAFCVLAAMAVLVGNQLASIGADLPRFQGTISDKIGALGAVSSPGGTFSAAMKALEEIVREVQTLGGSAGPGAGPAQKPIPVVVQDGGGLIGMLGGVVSPLLHPIATAFLVCIFAVFVLAARGDLRNRFIRLAGADDIQTTTAVIDDAARRLSRLFLMQLAVNTCFGLTISLGLWLIGIPSPLLWGILAGALRFIPYVGAIAGLLPAVALAIAVDPGWSMLAWTILLFAIVEPVLGHAIEPLLFGHSTGLSPIAVILAATVWTFLWGPIGLILATPLTVCLVVLGRHVGALGFLDVMLGDRPALSSPQIFYQRMLAGDPTEAVLQAREFLRERSLSTYYDEVALEALRLAHEDIARGRLSAPRQVVLRRSIGGLIERLSARPDPRPRGGQVGAEAGAAVMAAGPDRGAAMDVLTSADLRADWRGEAPAVCLARPDTLDEVIANMLAQVLSKHGVAARTSDLGETAGAAPDGSRNGVRIVCLSYLEPLSTLHLRYAVRLARKRYPGATVVLAIWRERDPVMGRTLGKAARADTMVSTIGAALSAVVGAAKAPVAVSDEARSQHVLATAAPMPPQPGETRRAA